MPSLMAGRINWVYETVMGVIGQAMMAGRRPAEVSREVLALIDEMEDLLSERVLGYAVRPS